MERIDIVLDTMPMDVKVFMSQNGIFKEFASEVVSQNEMLEDDEFYESILSVMEGCKSMIIAYSINCTSCKYPDKWIEFENKFAKHFAGK